MKKRILLVDDALFMRKLIRGILEDNNYEVVGEAENGFEAIELFSKLKPDLMLCDIVMPKKNGLETLQEIMQKAPTACVIMLSALSEQETVINALHLGAKDFLIKPVNKRKLIHTVQRVLSIEEFEKDEFLLIEFFNQIFDDLEFYIDCSTSKEILYHCKSVLRALEFKYPLIFNFNSKTERLGLHHNHSATFQEINELLNQAIFEAKQKTEQFIPFAESVFIEAFRFVYLRNTKNLMKCQHTIIFPPWLDKEVKFVKQVMEYLFKHE